MTNHTRYIPSYTYENEKKYDNYQLIVAMKHIFQQQRRFIINLQCLLEVGGRETRQEPHKRQVLK